MPKTKTNTTIFKSFKFGTVKAGRLQTKKLPDKPSELILAALADLEAVERSKEYTVDMSSWHRPRSRSICEVCFAGSVIAKSLGVARHRNQDNGSFDSITNEKLTFLDNCRNGSVSHEIYDVYGTSNEPWMTTQLVQVGLDTIDIKCPLPDYSEDVKGFKAGMRNMAKLFAKVGL